MLSLNDIERFYPENQRPFRRSILREFLQHRILQIIYETEYAVKLSFMGGTCLRLLFGTNRFSEDLDFDNFGLKSSEFDQLSQSVSKQLSEDGYTVEIKTVHKNAFRCYIRIPGILFSQKLSVYQEEKVLIQLDSEAQNFAYQPESFILNKFDIISRVNYTPKNILLAQKLWAILNRKTPKGRDFYDVMYLFSIAEPDYRYLELRAGINDSEQLQLRLQSKIQTINFKELLSDVRPFLIFSSDLRRIELFPEFVASLTKKNLR